MSSKIGNRVIGLAALAMGLAGGGCAPPMGQQNNRVEVTDTTAAERGSRLVTTTELSEFRDQVAQQLALDISELEEFQEYRATIVYGDLENNTGIVPTTDFEAFRTGLRGKLINSRVTRNRVRWVQDRSSYEALRRKELAPSDDLLQESGRAGAGDRKLNEDHTFFLNGQMYRVSRGNDAMQLYAMSFNLMRAGDGEIVWQSEPYESKRVLR